MSDLLADLDGLNSFVKRGPECNLGKLLGTLDPSVAEKLLAKIDDASIPTTNIAKLLGKHGHRIGAVTVMRHRRRGTNQGCRCS
jgi:hypothetical protein